MSERYVPPPPPYELSLQRDQKVSEGVQALEVSKESPFRDEECKDSKHSKAFADGTFGDIAIRSLSSVPKRPTRSDSAGLRASRPLPPHPAGDIGTRPLGPRGQESRPRPVVQIKTYAVQNDHEREPHSPAPPFSAIESSLGEPSYLQSMLHPSTSVHSSPSHYPSQLSYDTPRRNYDNRRPVSTYSPIEPGAETSFRRSSHVPSQSMPHSLPQNRNSETRLLFDPSVAYSNSQANTRTAFSAQRGVGASLYSSAVSSHLHLDSAISGSRQSYVPVRAAHWNTETPDLDKTDVSSVRSYPLVPMYSSPSTSSLYTPRSRSRSSGGYEQRWATSESDITRDVYQN